MGMILAIQPDETVEKLLTDDTVVDDETEGASPTQGCNTSM